MSPPFDAAKLDRLLDSASVDLVLACSPHNVQYLLGGYRFFLFANGIAMGVSSYLPFVGYAKGRPDSAFYVGNALERGHQEVEPLWVPEAENASWSSVEAGELAARRIRRLGLELIRAAAEGIVGSMQAVFAAARPGITTAELAERLRLEETRRGLAFEFCQSSVGPSFNRTPTPAVRWELGQCAAWTPVAACRATSATSPGWRSWGPRWRPTCAARATASSSSRTPSS